jgi:hypothetical protein
MMTPFIVLGSEVAIVRASGRESCDCTCDSREMLGEDVDMSLEMRLADMRTWCLDITRYRGAVQKDAEDVCCFEIS